MNQTALSLVIPQSVNGNISVIRQKMKDTSAKVWPTPQINLFAPFVDERQFHYSSGRLASLLATVRPFVCALDTVRYQPYKLPEEIHVGARVQVFRRSNWYDAKVVHINPKVAESFDIKFADGSIQKNCPRICIRNNGDKLQAGTKIKVYFRNSWYDAEVETVNKEKDITYDIIFDKQPERIEKKCPKYSFNLLETGYIYLTCQQTQGLEFLWNSIKQEFSQLQQLDYFMPHIRLGECEGYKAEKIIDFCSKQLGQVKFMVSNVSFLTRAGNTSAFTIKSTLSLGVDDTDFAESVSTDHDSASTAGTSTSVNSDIFRNKRKQIRESTKKLIATKKSVEIEWTEVALEIAKLKVMKNQGAKMTEDIAKLEKQLAEIEKRKVLKKEAEIKEDEQKMLGDLVRKQKEYNERQTMLYEGRRTQPISITDSVRFILKARTRVTSKRSPHSRVVNTLVSGRYVIFSEKKIRGNRAKIVWPCEGWIDRTVQNGLIVRPSVILKGVPGQVSKSELEQFLWDSNVEYQTLREITRRKGSSFWKLEFRDHKDFELCKGLSQRISTQSPEGRPKTHTHNSLKMTLYQAEIKNLPAQMKPEKLEPFLKKKRLEFKSIFDIYRVPPKQNIYVVEFADEDSFNKALDKEIPYKTKTEGKHLKITFKARKVYRENVYVHERPIEILVEPVKSYLNFRRNIGLVA